MKFACPNRTGDEQVERSYRWTTVMSEFVGRNARRRVQDNVGRKRPQSRQLHRFALAALAVGSTVYIITSGTTPLLAFLPALYAVLIVLLPNMLDYRTNNIGVTTLNIVIALRYVVAPAIWAHGPGAIRGVASSDESFRWAVVLMVVELVAAFLVVAALAPKYLAKSATKTSTSFEPISALQPTPILLLVAGMGLLLLMAVPEVRGRYNFAFDTAALESPASIEAPTLLLLVSDMSLVIVPLLLVSFFQRRFDAGGGMAWGALAFMACLPAMVLYEGSSRFSVLIPTVAVMVILVRSFPRYARMLRAIVAAILVSVIAVLSLVKNFSSAEGTPARDALSVTHLSPLLDAYLSGPQNMGRAIDLLSMHERSIGGLTDDVLANIVVLSRLSDREETTAVLFNQYFYGYPGTVDQIIPLSGQSLLHFGVIGAPVFMLLATWMLVRMDGIIASERRIELVYGYVYVTIYLGCAMMLSFGSTFSSFTNVLLPLVVVMVFANPSRYLSGVHS